MPSVSVVKTGVNDVAWARVGLELSGRVTTSQRNWFANSELPPLSVMGVFGGTRRSSPACAIGLPGRLILPSALTYFVLKSLTSGAINDAGVPVCLGLPKRFEVQQRQRHATLVEDEPRNILGVTGEFFPCFEIYIHPLLIWEFAIWTEVCTPNRMTDNAVVQDDFAVKPISIGWPIRSVLDFQPSGTKSEI